MTWYKIQNNEIMITEYYVDTNNLKPFIRFFHFFDCSNQTSITSVRNKIFRYCKKYFVADAV